MISLKVDGFSHRSHVDDIEELFSKYGKVGDVYIPKVSISTIQDSNDKKIAPIIIYKLIVS